jgi:hypothetical protein
MEDGATTVSHLVAAGVMATVVVLAVGEVVRARCPVNSLLRAGAASATRVNFHTKTVVLVALETTAAVEMVVDLGIVLPKVVQDLGAGQALSLVAGLVEATLAIHSVHHVDSIEIRREAPIHDT